MLKSSGFDFSDGEVEIHGELSRRDFERWIAPITASIARSLDETLARTGMSAGEVDCVFMTGGTAFVPVVRALFEARSGRASCAAATSWCRSRRGWPCARRPRAPEPPRGMRKLLGILNAMIPCGADAGPPAL